MLLTVQAQLLLDKRTEGTRDVQHRITVEKRKGTGPSILQDRKRSVQRPSV